MPRVRLITRSLVVPAEGEKLYADPASEHDVSEEEATRLISHGAAEPVESAEPKAKGKGKAKEAEPEPEQPEGEAEQAQAGRYRRTDMKAKE